MLDYRAHHDLHRRVDAVRAEQTSATGTGCPIPVRGEDSSKSFRVMPLSRDRRNNLVDAGSQVFRQLMFPESQNDPAEPTVMPRDLDIAPAIPMDLCAPELDV